MTLKCETCRRCDRSQTEDLIVLLLPALQLGISRACNIHMGDLIWCAASA